MTAACLVPHFPCAPSLTVSCLSGPIDSRRLPLAVKVAALLSEMIPRNNGAGAGGSGGANNADSMEQVSSLWVPSGRPLANVGMLGFGMAYSSVLSCLS